MLITNLNIVKEEWKDRLAISAEDYLHGLISLVNELVCLLIVAAGRCPRTLVLLPKFAPGGNALLPIYCAEYMLCKTTPSCRLSNDVTLITIISLALL